MKNTTPTKKSDTAHREEAILSFWQENDIFQKSLTKDAPKGDFVFYDGPPFATGLPHYGHILPGTIKDIIPRYKTMQGYHVPRKWGWDCHGLPIENLIEKELGLITKKDIEEYGIETFNEAARASVLRYEEEWKHYIPRSGRWADMDNAYTSMNPWYMESGWWIFSELYKKGLTTEGFKAMHLCPRCETTLANFEVNQGYKDVTDISVTAKFALIDKPDTYLLAWTTTPWTLPGNVALAVGNDIEYVKIAHEGENFIVAKELSEKVFEGKEHDVIETLKGSNLVGNSYVPVFDYYQKQDDPRSEPGTSIENKENGWKVYPADFVTTEEGTGIVHIAPAFGSDDMELGKTHKLPFIQHVAKNGTFTDDFATTKEGESFKGMYVKTKDDLMSTDIEIIKVLAESNTLFAKQKLVHSYPHCWRCDTPLINYATSSWYVDVPQIKERLLEHNSAVHWVPEHIGEGRFGKWLEGAREWALSRSRFWGTPLPVWKSYDGEEIFVASSIQHLLDHVVSSGNSYFGLRHGESENNITGTINADPTIPSALTEKGRNDTYVEVNEMKKNRSIDLIFVSPFQRTRETADIVKEVYGLSDDAIIVDERLREIFPGSSREGTSWHEAHTDEESQDPKDFWNFHLEHDAESIGKIYRRAMDFLFDIESRYQNKNILIISHGGVFKAMQFGAAHYGDASKARDFYAQNAIPTNAKLIEIPFKPFPHTPDYILDLHRPYIDDITVLSPSGKTMKRIEDIFDVWFDSGSMPYAQVHYPFENQENFEQTRFPADFIAEGLDQTRGWFYVLSVLGVALFDKVPFKNVVVNGLLLAEDGKKMSKSLKNYPDLYIVLDNQGADALRLFLMSSPLVRAEEHPFSEKGVQEVQSKVMGRLRNIMSFYQMYQEDIQHESHADSTHLLDQWIVARLREMNRGITDNLEQYYFDKATKYIFDFVDDFSTWYIRRSRDRYKGEDENDKRNALATTRYILKETAKCIAPFVPFIAEEIWQTLKDETMEESVHLASWTGFEVQDDGNILSHMAEVRDIISVGLQKRAESGIKVRQPLRLFTAPIMNIPSEYYELILDELNVKKVEQGEYALDTDLDEELVAEGAMRELLRQLQDFRKKKNLSAHDVITLNVATDEKGKELVERFQNHLQKAAGITSFVFVEKISEGEELSVDNLIFTISI